MDVIFQERGIGGVEQEITQRDQFNTDEVALVSALVREPHQNSLDARSSTNTGVVRTRLHIVEPPQLGSTFFANLFAKLLPHLYASDIDIAGIDLGKPRLLVIEDFGTTGLLGNYEDPEDERPFSDFWRRFGRSHKGGAKGGRWGLGKLVYSTASRLGVFFGLTIREDDPDRTPLLMGQAVLLSHKIDGKRYMPHGFFGVGRDDGLELPVTDAAVIEKFRAACEVNRTNEPGLSIVVPFLLEEITTELLVVEVLKNYFFPILTGQLEVKVAGTLISAATFDEVAAQYATGYVNDQIISFIRKVNGAMEQPPDVVLKPTWTRDFNGAVSDEELDNIRKAFAAGELVHAKAPLALIGKDGARVNSHLDLFLMHAPEGTKAEALYVRGGITVPDERRYFHARQTFAALIATDAGVTSFLGDAETPSHTQWNGAATKLKKNWQSGASRLSEIRHSLDRLHQLVAQAVELREPDALKDFFSIKDAGGEPGPKPPGPKPPVPPIPGKPKKFSITPREGGFAVKGGPGLTPSALPFKMTVRAAYDVFRGNPFKRFNDYDFSFKRSDLQITADGATVSPIGDNKLEIDVSACNFSVVVSGFDENRDVVVDAR